VAWVATLPPLAAAGMRHHIAMDGPNARPGRRSDAPDPKLTS
jgi:hypothetical protein